MRILYHISLWKLALSPSGKSAGPEWPREGGIGQKTTALVWPSHSQGWKKSLCVKMMDFMDKHLRKTQHFCGYSLWELKHLPRSMASRSTHPQRLMVMAGAPPQPSTCCCAEMWSDYVSSPPTSQEKLEICILYEIPKLLKVKVAQSCPTRSNPMDL